MDVTFHVSEASVEYGGEWAASCFPLSIGSVWIRWRREKSFPCWESNSDSRQALTKLFRHIILLEILMLRMNSHEGNKTDNVTFEVFMTVKILVFWLYTRCIQKFPDWVDDEINNDDDNNKHARSNTNGYGGKTHWTDSQNSNACSFRSRRSVGILLIYPRTPCNNIPCINQSLRRTYCLPPEVGGNRVLRNVS
jgi:hypothetical protein